MHWAVGFGAADIRDLLIQNGADLNIKDKDGTTALMLAITENQIESALVLLVQDSIDLNQQDKKGMTPLILAAANCHEDVLVELINKDVNIEIRDAEGKTALDYLRSDCNARVDDSKVSAALESRLLRHRNAERVEEL